MKIFQSKNAEIKEDDDENESLDNIQITAANGNWGPDTLAFFGKDSRAILISGEITTNLANCVISQLLELATESDDEPIYCYINTDGGDCIAGMAIYDMMRVITCPVITVVIGACHSAGLFILQGGDRRGATPQSSFFYHELLSFRHVVTQEGNASSAEHYKHLLEQMNKILLDRSKMSKTVWKKDFQGKTGFFFPTNKALEYKLIDEVVEYAKPKPIKIKPPHG